STEITGYAVVCIAMHMRKINQVRFWRVFGGVVACFTGFPSETHLIYFTHMHGYAHHRIAGDFGREKGPGR
ncbi:hypothetical protein VSS05_27370, partial [Klebsiella pneumoniae]|nr:hypothetical protein [Klebsiella pneumoniae]